ncbi:hypothetical protein [Brevibacterium spongiae]|uniref:Integrase n=1 Tax=Brevibacterium spongiae TaxID=2909672 RepID=A0ABY5SQQ5_9MICO|nr:hypothetical protein [Brevibacterium spongiae]UVI35391.1 hypothetical protein L1F31_14895 [Brevibacterium spongiae]
MNISADVDVRDYLDLYSSARKKDKGWILDEIMILTGWSRDHTRRRLSQLAIAEAHVDSGAIGSGAEEAPTGPPTPGDRTARRCRYSPESRALLVTIWEWSGHQSGKYLAAAMPRLLEAAERHGALVPDRDGYSSEVRSELLSVSPASIDRYLSTTRAGEFHERRISTKRFNNPSEEFLEFASGSNQAEPGFFLVDTIAHAGPTRPRNCAFTVSATCLHTGWVFTHSLGGNESTDMVGLLEWSLDEVQGIPFWVNAIELSNAEESVHEGVGRWAGNLDIHFSPILKDHQRDRLPEASRHQHLVHEYGSIRRYDTDAARHALNELWRAVDDRLNYFTPTRKPSGWDDDGRGGFRRTYDDPRTPFDRLRAAGVMSPGQEAELIDYAEGLDPARLTEEIVFWQKRLEELAA